MHRLDVKSMISKSDWLDPVSIYRCLPSLMERVFIHYIEVPRSLPAFTFRGEMRIFSRIGYELLSGIEAHSIYLDV